MADDDPADLARFAARGRQIQEVLQSIEDALIEAGYEDFAVATEHGRFQWIRAPEGRCRNHWGLVPFRC